MTRALLLMMLIPLALPAFAHDVECDAKQWRAYLGESVEQLEDDGHLPPVFRVIYPDSQRNIAPDPVRLNFEVDANDVVRDVHCG